MTLIDCHSKRNNHSSLRECNDFQLKSYLYTFPRTSSSHSLDGTVYSTGDSSMNETASYLTIAYPKLFGGTAYWTTLIKEISSGARSPI